MIPDRSAGRKQKEQAVRERFTGLIEEAQRGHTHEINPNQGGIRISSVTS
jgi:hypothetical protein